MALDRCPSCDTPYRSSSSAFCSNCGAKRPGAKPNHCTNLNCENYDVDLGEDALFCDVCGCPTVIESQIEDMT